jgi:UDP:flavonoid glycosyltransferase YjiC (YdhE family)
MLLNNKPKTILVAVLDWGLGHAARIIPVIKNIESKGGNVIIASSGDALKMLEHEYPDKTIMELPAYNPVYHKSIGMGLSMALQTPKFFKTIYDENVLLKKIVKEYSIDGIISDNRYGMFHNKIPSVIVTHQIFIQTSHNQNFLQPLLKKINFQFLNKFNFCWIPDVPGATNLSGSLSHGDIPSHCRYTGLLSRFEKKEKDKKYDLMILLSGPEPQRTVLENILLKQLPAIREKKVLLVRGKMNDDMINVADNVVVKNFLSGTELERDINSSDIIISRSGYSSAMDIINTRSKAVFIPTPGQTEQEYLVDYWKDKKWFYSEAQTNLDLKRAIKKSEKYSPPLIFTTTNDLLDKAVNEFLDYL